MNYMFIYYKYMYTLYIIYVIYRLCIYFSLNLFWLVSSSRYYLISQLSYTTKLLDQVINIYNLYFSFIFEGKNKSIINSMYVSHIPSSTPYLTNFLFSTLFWGKLLTYYFSINISKCHWEIFFSSIFWISTHSWTCRHTSIVDTK